MYSLSDLKKQTSKNVANTTFKFWLGSKCGNKYLQYLQHRHWNTSTNKICEICTQLTIKTPEWFHWHHYSVSTLNLQRILRCSGVSMVAFEQENADWANNSSLTVSNKHHMYKALSKYFCWGPLLKWRLSFCH